MTLDEYNDLADNDRIDFTNPATNDSAKGTVVRISDEEIAIVWDDNHRVQRIRKSEFRVFIYLFEAYRAIKNLRG